MDIGNFYKWHSRLKKGIRIKIVLTLIFFLFSCVTLNNTTKKNITGTGINPGSIQEAMLDKAFTLIGRKYMEIVYSNNKKFTLDCYGLVSLVYDSIGIDFSEHLAKFGGGGVSALYSFFKSIGIIHANKHPSIGDIIFWDNTWDRNGDNNNLNDPCTHAGMVVKVNDDGTINYIHANYTRGIIVEKMNLYRPAEIRDQKGRLLNSPMHIYSYTASQPARWTSGELWKEFGNVLDNQKKLNQ